VVASGACFRAGSGDTGVSHAHHSIANGHRPGRLLDRDKPRYHHQSFAAERSAVVIEHTCLNGSSATVVVPDAHRLHVSSRGSEWSRIAPRQAAVQGHAIDRSGDRPERVGWQARHGRLCIGTRHALYTVRTLETPLAASPATTRPQTRLDISTHGDERTVGNERSPPQDRDARGHCEALHPVDVGGLGPLRSLNLTKGRLL
jgi:hypothetical protein